MAGLYRLYFTTRTGTVCEIPPCEMVNGTLKPSGVCRDTETSTVYTPATPGVRVAWVTCALTPPTVTVAPGSKFAPLISTVVAADPAGTPAGDRPVMEGTGRYTLK